ncbi:MAG: hypothetical protein JST26_05565 [Bacteroidetes bacterium]|nr:hypothetical protein [Bacteroidota bacterium]
MVRIINNQKPKEQVQPEVTLSEKSKVLLQVIGIVIADQPDKIRSLLEDYSVSFDKEPTEQELSDKLLDAIAECNSEFNNDLTGLILDCTLENSSYDSFDFKSLFNKNKDADAGAENNSGGGGGGGLWGGIANAVGGIGSAIGQGIKGKQAKDQASANTLQGMYAYKSQLAANEGSKTKHKTLMLVTFFILLGLALTALVYYSKKPAPKPLLPPPIKV